MLTKENIVQLLETNDRAVERALVVLLDRQTQIEQSAEETISRNDRGFLPYHARKFSSMAKWVARGNHLSPKQLAYIRRKGISKYTRQLLEAAKEKAGQKQVKLPLTNSPQGLHEDFELAARREATLRSDSYAEHRMDAADMGVI